MQAPDPRWLRLWAGFPAPEGATRAWDDLVARYSEPARAYHTLAHVLDCLRELDACGEAAADPEAVEAALWFHDVVYDPRGTGNEEASARLAGEVLGQAGMPRARLDQVERLILATRHAAAPSDDADAALVVDVDLSILGAEPARFDRYEQAIAVEYAWVPAEIFRVKRAQVLRGFLARPAVFSTAAFQARLEAQARENLARSLAALGAVTPTP